MKYTLSSPETEAILAIVDRQESGSWEIALPDGKGGESKRRLGAARVSFDGNSIEIQLSEPSGHRLVFPAIKQGPSGIFVVATPLGNIRILPSRGVALAGADAGQGGTKAIKSSMPGKVLKVFCKVGDKIEAGAPLLIIEAMKMENEIRSPQSGLVEEIGVGPGQSIQTGDLLVKLGKA